MPGSTRVRKRSKGHDGPLLDSVPQMSKPKAVSPVVAVSAVQRKIAPDPPREPFSRDAESRTLSPPVLPASSGSRPSGRPPLLGLPRAMVDDLLAVYFTHVHVSVVPGYRVGS